MDYVTRVVGDQLSWYSLGYVTQIFHDQVAWLKLFGVVLSDVLVCFRRQLSPLVFTLLIFGRV